jgi:hypothetical protein
LYRNSLSRRRPCSTNARPWTGTWRPALDVRDRLAEVQRLLFPGVAIGTFQRGAR